MPVQGLYAVVCVTDLDAAIAWYTKVMGSPPRDHPIPDMAQWRGDSGHIQLWKSHEHAGHSMCTIVFTDLKTDVEQLIKAGLSPSVIRDAGGFGISKLSDPDGNLLTLTEAPKG